MKTVFPEGWSVKFGNENGKDGAMLQSNLRASTVSLFPITGQLRACYTCCLSGNASMGLGNVILGMHHSAAKLLA